jgi:FtsH-binding integral membrane protein
MFTSRFIRPVRHIFTQISSSNALIVRHKWDSAKGNKNVNKLITEPHKMKINIDPVPSNVLNSISLNDYAKMTLTQTSINILGIGSVTGVGMFTCLTLINNGLIDPLILGTTAITGGFVGGVYSIIKMKDQKPEIVYNKKENKYNIVDNQTRKNLLYGFIASQGIMVTPFMMINLEYIIPAMFITTAITAGPVAYAYMNPSNDISSIGTFLSSSLIGLCTIGITGLIFPSIGQYWFQPEPYIGIIIMSGYNWYDTQCMIQSYNEKKLDPIGHSVNYTLNFMNILIRIITLMRRRNQN